MRAILILLCSLVSIFSYPQSNVRIDDVRNIFDEKGDYYFDRKEYKKAIVYYNMAYQNNANNYYSVLRKAEAYTELGLFDQGAECYRILFETNLRIPNEYRLQYALLLLKNRDIKGFEEWLGKYNDVVFEETSDKLYLSNAEVRAKMYKDTSFVIVENESVLNTPESEISPVFFKEKVIFASTRKNLSGSTGNNYYNLFSANFIDAGHLGRLNSFNTNLNTLQNEILVSVAESENKIYITRGTTIKTNLKTYVSNIPADNKTVLDIREFKIDGFPNIGQVTFNSNGTKMFFVSDAPGGFGGTDIYFCNKEGGSWGKPRNLGNQINTSKDELFPCLLNDSVLFFASAGHKGLGGFDLYSVKINKENDMPKNLGSMVNTEFDEYGLYFTPKGTTGYFSSNRPGGFGKEDIYRIHLLDIKVKLPAFKFKKKTFMESDKINLYLSNGDEYNISSPDKKGFDFGFMPGESYKMVIQHENPLATNIIYNTQLTGEQRKKAFLYPSPVEKTEIRLQTGMKYDYTAGVRPISEEFKKDLNEMSKEYQGSGGNTIDLTALAKELLIKEGEVYTIQFVKDENQFTDSKTKTQSVLFINNQAIDVSGNSFFIMLPLDVQANFNIKTDIQHFKKTFSPKKTGPLKVDETPVYKEEPVKLSEGFPILVNTESFSEASSKVIAKELTIVPGTMYILTLAKTDKETGKNLELVVPLTKGVKYNLGTEGQSEKEYNKALSQFASVQAAGSKLNEELIDISVLSKELDITPKDSIVFSLMPAPQIAAQASGARNVLSTLDVDGRKYFVTNKQKLQIKLKLEQNMKVNIQTDLAYVKENFDPSTISVTIDTSSFNKDIVEKAKDIITDPVYDIIVVNFNLNDYAVRADARKILADEVINVLKGDNRLYVTIKGYTDGLGDPAYNKKLSGLRAQAVKDFLSSNGITENRIRTFSFGESMALKPGEKWQDLSEEELQKHRKVEIVIYLPK